jgi:hypothetical protein
LPIESEVFFLLSPVHYYRLRARSIMIFILSAAALVYLLKRIDFENCLRQESTIQADENGKNLFYEG